MILGFDTETTGVDPKKDRIIEIGAVLFDRQFRVQKKFSSFVYEESIGDISEEITRITRITLRDLREAGKPFSEVLQSLHKDFLGDEPVDAVIAHNAPFDKGVLTAEIARHNCGFLTNLLALPWICSMSDLLSNREKKCKKLAHLALDYGVAVDPKGLHRASADCELMGQMLVAAGANYEDMLRRSVTPTVVVQAMVPSPFGPKGDGGKGKEIAKAHGYRWQSPGEGIDREWDKSWVKAVKENEVEAEREKLPYPVTVHIIAKV